MLDLNTLVSSLRRPGLLVKAARYGLDSYNRQTALKKLLLLDEAPRPGAAIMQLIDLERTQNDRRLAKSGEYDCVRHITILTAIMGEARLLQTLNRTPE